MYSVCPRLTKLMILLLLLLLLLLLNGSERKNIRKEVIYIFIYLYT